MKQMLILVALATVALSCNTGTKTTSDSQEAGTEKSEMKSPYTISLAQWSLHQTFFGGPIENWGEFAEVIRTNPDAAIQGTDPMEFPRIAAKHGIYVIELVNTMYYSKVKDMEYWDAFKKKCDEHGVSVSLIMCDLLGDLGHADPEVRKQNVENHYPWVDAAFYLGADAIRVNAGGAGSEEEVAANAAEGLKMLGEYAANAGIDVVVENHGGYSSNGKWLSGLMEAVDMDNVGTLPDFGNFCIEWGPDGCANQYDIYLGMEELMPYAKGVSAKSHEFDAEGNETTKDFLRIMKIVKAAGFSGNVGIEYEGDNLSEEEGIKATKALLEKVFAEL